MALFTPAPSSARTAGNGWLGWLHRRTFQRAPRQLRVLEYMPISDRRFVAVVQAGQRRFLIGATTQSLNLLAELEPETVAPLGDLQ